MVVPSKQENFSNTILESLSSGTPVIAFDVGGNEDLISHKLNGYLVEPYDIEDLIKGIKLTVYDANLHDMGMRARSKVETLFNPAKVAQSYKDMYLNFLNTKPSKQFIQS